MAFILQFTVPDDDRQVYLCMCGNDPRSVRAAASGRPCWTQLTEAGLPEEGRVGLDPVRGDGGRIQQLVDLVCRAAGSQQTRGVHRTRAAGGAGSAAEASAQGAHRVASAMFASEPVGAEAGEVVRRPERSSLFRARRTRVERRSAMAGRLEAACQGCVSLPHSASAANLQAVRMQSASIRPFDQIFHNTTWHLTPDV